MGKWLSSMGSRPRALLSFGTGQQNLPFGITYIMGLIMGLDVLNEFLLKTCWLFLTN